MSLDLNNTGPQHVHYDLEDLSARLAERAADWVPKYFPRGKISADRKELRLANISGNPPRNQGSCVIALKGEDAGCWWEFDGAKGGGPLDTLSHATELFGRELFEKAAVIVRRFGAKPDKKLVDRQAAMPSSWKTPCMANRRVW